MSSILNALKKLENQATDQKHVRFWQSKSHMRSTDHERINGHQRFKSSYVIIFAGLIIAVGAGLVLNQIRHEKKPELMTKKEAVIRKSFRPPENKAVIPHRVQKELPSQKDEKRIGPIAKAARTTPSSDQKPTINTAVSSHKKTSPLKQVQQKETVSAKRSGASQQVTDTDRFESMQVKQSNQTNIELQAIAWANDPKSRLAVINGIIVRERESIDNVIVMHIGKDEVIFKKGGEEWKQMFGF